MKPYKYAVLTYLFGGYDKLHPILKKTPDTQYVLVTDNRNLVSDDWTIVYKDFPTTYNDFDKCLYVRYHPFEFCDADVVIKVDASVQICGDLTPVYQKFEERDDKDRLPELAVHLHPTRTTAYDELVAWVQSRGMAVDDANKVLQVMAQMENYDVKNYRNLYQLSWTIQRNTRTQQVLNDLAYAYNRYMGNTNDFRCDQVVWSFVIAKYFNAIPIQFYDQRILDSHYFKWYPHNSDVPYAPMKPEEMCKAHAFNKRIMTIRPQDL